MYFVKLTFGKHKGKTLPQVLLTDPSWFFWAHENGTFGSKQRNTRVLLHARAISIRIPDVGGVPAKAMYTLDPSTKRLAGVKIVPKTYNGVNSPHIFFSDSLSLGVPSRHGINPNFYTDPVLELVKRIYFGSPTAVLTKEQCEEFFADASNFLLTVCYDDDE